MPLAKAFIFFFISFLCVCVCVCVFDGIIWDSSYNLVSKTACQLFNDHGNYLLQASCKPCSINMNPKNDASALEMFRVIPHWFWKDFPVDCKVLLGFSNLDPCY